MHRQPFRLLPMKQLLTWPTLSQPTLWIANVWVQIVDNQSHQNDDNMPNDCGQKDLAAISEPQQQAVLQQSADAPSVRYIVADGHWLESAFWNNS
jgi:hypothetical protein